MLNCLRLRDMVRKMREFNYVPIYRVGFNEISHGIEIKACDFCCRNCGKNKKCQQFYESLLNMEDGEYRCPYGFAVSIFSDEVKEKYVFTSLRLENVYDAKLVDSKIRQSAGDKKQYRKITKDELERYKEYYIEYKEGVESYANLKNFVEDIFHDIRKFNGQLKGKGEILCKDTASHKKLRKFSDTVQNIRAICAYMTLRLNAYDFIYNEVPMDATEKSSYNIFKIFDKVRHCLSDRAKNKALSIDIKSKGECGDIRAYDCIELLPYILLDNAIKYAEKRSQILVDIDDNANRCRVQVTSRSVKLKEGEREKVFLRGFRGENAIKCTTEGLGIGLYTAKKICELHQATIEVSERVDNHGNNNFVIDITINKEYNN